ncbi:MAG: adenosylmethionine--8-amino-7-oxononanoate transaminase [Gammaproteobacteria bacterium]
MSTTRALDRDHVWHPFTQEHTAPPPVPIRSASGSVLVTEEGDEILDLVSSWWVNLHGHAHPRIAGAIGEQAGRLEQVIFAGFTHEPAARLSAELAQRLPGDLERVFFSDDGSTAVEVGLKMASQYWRNRDAPRRRFLAFEGGYHGDTVGAMSAGVASGFFDTFSDMLFPVDTLPFPETWEDDAEVEAKEARSLAALEAYLDAHGGETAALIMEPLVQGAGGMRMCRPEFMQALAARLRAHDILIIFDEVMTGFGRTGTLFASERAGVTPDIICLSKGLTAGYLAMSVTVCTSAIYEAFLDESFDKALVHGHSFTANPLGCAAGLASLALFDEEPVMERIAAMEHAHRAAFEEIARHPRARHWRVTGSIAALDIAVPDGGYNSEAGPWLKAFFLERGLLLRPLGNVLYMLPPYCTTDAQLQSGYEGIAEALERLPV